MVRGIVWKQWRKGTMSHCCYCSLDLSSMTYENLSVHFPFSRGLYNCLWIQLDTALSNTGKLSWYLWAILRYTIYTSIFSIHLESISYKDWVRWSNITIFLTKYTLLQYRYCRDEITDQKPSVMGIQKASIETSTTVWWVQKMTSTYFNLTFKTRKRQHLYHIMMWRYQYIRSNITVTMYIILPGPTQYYTKIKGKGQYSQSLDWHLISTP